MIKRRYVHLFFMIVSLCLVLAIGWQALTLYQQEQLSQQLASIPEAINALDAPEAPEIATHTDNHPLVKLALGSALSQGNNLEQTERLLNELARDADDSTTRVAAQYNLANAYLRQALASGRETSSKSLPLVELAKQRYRDLLSEDTDHWSARYNLERALRMAPEGTDRTDDGRIEPVKSVDVIVPGFEKKDLP